MAFRRKKENVASQRQWQQFMADNVDRARAIGLPPGIVADEELWRDVLCYGWAERAGPSDISDEITTGFHVSRLSQSKYQTLVLLAERYFEAGFAYLEPLSLRDDDRSRLRARFGPDMANVAQEDAHGDRG